MTRAKKTKVIMETSDEEDVPSFWKVRIGMPGGIIHVASSTRPVVRFEGGRIAGVDLEIIPDTEYGDTIGFLQWETVTALTWRKS